MRQPGLALAALLHLLAGGARGIHVKGHERSGRTTRTLIHAYFVNTEGSTERRECMESQLAVLQRELEGINVDFRFDRWPAVELSSCRDVRDCMREVPECFPTKKAGKMTRSEATDQSTAIRGTIGNWCAHLKLMPEMLKRFNMDVDYFFILEDDLIFDPKKMADAIYSLLQVSRHHWSLVAFDTFGPEAKFQRNLQRRSKPPPQDLAAGGLDMYAISHAWGYWGAHAWLVDALHANRFGQFYKGSITLPADWIPKVKRPLHLGMMSYQTGILTQKNLLATKNPLRGACQMESQSDILGKPDALLAEGSHTFSFRRENRSGRAPLPLVIDRGSVIREVIMLGMHNSGVDMLYKMFHDNFEVPGNIELCKSYKGVKSCGQVWVHTNPKRLQENFMGLDQAMAVVVVRHPFSQIRSWQKTDYEPGCWNYSRTSGCNFTKTETGTNKHREGMARVPRPLCDSAKHEELCWASMDKGKPEDVTWDSMSWMWNSYMEGYLELDKWFKKVIILRFEDIVENPAEAMQEVAYGLDMQPPGRSKDQPLFLVKSQLRTRALQKLGTFDYESTWSRQEFGLVCSRLHHPVLFQYGYHGCQDFKEDVYNTIRYEMD